MKHEPKTLKKSYRNVTWAAWTCAAALAEWRETNSRYAYITCAILGRSLYKFLTNADLGKDELGIRHFKRATNDQCFEKIKGLQRSAGSLKTFTSEQIAHILTVKPDPDEVNQAGKALPHEVLEVMRGFAGFVASVDKERPELKSHMSERWVSGFAECLKRLDNPQGQSAPPAA